MFHLADNVVTEADLDVLEEAGNVELDGFIWYDGERGTRRNLHNVCEILLLWKTEETFGVQGIRLGVEETLTRIGWRKRLQKNDYMQSMVAERCANISRVFSEEPVTYKVLGWRLLNVVFWKPTGMIRIGIAPEPKVTPLNATRNILAPVAKKTHAS